MLRACALRAPTSPLPLSPDTVDRRATPVRAGAGDETGAGALLRLRPAEQRSRPPLSGRLAGALPRGLTVLGVLAAFLVHSLGQRRRRGAAAARDRLAGRRRSRDADLARIRARTVGPPSSSGKWRGALAHLGASTWRPRRRSRRPSRTPNGHEWPPPLEPLRPSDAPGATVAPTPSSSRVEGRSGWRPEGRPSRSSSTTRRAGRTPRSTAEARSQPASTAPRSLDRGLHPGLYELIAHQHTERHSSRSSPPRR